MKRRCDPVYVVYFVFGAVWNFDYMIIHLWAPIYPLLLAFYVGPFCERSPRMLNEQLVKKSLSSS